MTDEKATVNISKEQMDRFRLLKSKHEVNTQTPNLADHEFFEWILNELNKKL